MRKKRRLMVGVFIAMAALLIFGGVAYSADTEYVGRVTLVEGYALPNYTGCHALVAMNVPATGPVPVPTIKTVAVMTTAPGLQGLLQTALATGNLIHFWGQKDTNPPLPRGGKWGVDVYKITGVILYNIK